jgi:hypothetical protein
LSIPVTVYQEEQTGGSVRGICYLPGEGHLAFSGSLLQLLEDDELVSVLARELALIFSGNASPYARSLTWNSSQSTFPCAGTGFSGRWTQRFEKGAALKVIVGATAIEKPLKAPVMLKWN